MIGLVYSHKRKETLPDSSWWVAIPRESWAAEVMKQWLERLKYQASIPEPTARKMKLRKHRDRDAKDATFVKELTGYDGGDEGQ